MEQLFITRSFNNRGGQVVLTNLVRGLMEQGVDTTLVGFRPAGTEDFPDSAHLYQGLNTEVIEVPARDNKPDQTKEYVDAATGFLQNEHPRYDKIILDSWYIALAGITARLDCRRTFQLVQSIPHFTPKDGSEFYESQLLGLLPRFPMQRIMVSGYDQAIFEQDYGQQHPKIDLYVNAAYRNAEFKVEDRPVTRFVSSAADFTLPTKGLEFLLTSLDELKGGPFMLTLVSGKPIPPEFLEGHAYPIKVEFAQTPEHMVEILREQDVYVKTSVREDFCLALAEAITLGMPALALDSGGNRDYARGDNFMFVQNSADFVPKLEQIRNINLRRRLHAAARPSMAAYSNLDNMVRQFRDITGM